MLIRVIIDISRYSPLFAFIVSALLSFWIYFNNPKNPKNIFFSLFGLDLSIWALCCFMQSVTQNYQTALLFDQVLYTVAAVAPALFIHCISIFTGKGRGNVIFLSYLVGIIFLFVNWTPYFRQGVVLNFGTRYVTAPGIGWYLYLLTYTVIVSIALYDLMTALIRTSGKAKQQLRYVLYAFLILLLGGQSYFVLILGKINHLTDSILNLSSSILLSVYNLLIALIISKYKFLDIRVVISRAVAEGITIVFLGSIYLALVWLYRGFVSTRLDFLFLSGTILYGVLVGQTHPRIRLFLQTTSDKVFLRGKYDYYRELAEMSGQITRSLSRGNILRALQRLFYEVVEVSNPRVYLTADFEKAEVQPYIALFAAGEKGPVFKNNELVVPCRAESKLLALLVIGKKLSEDPYTDEDLRLLKNLANQVAVALDHERIYAEKLTAEKRLLEAEKEAAVGRVSARLAGEILAPIEAIKAKIRSASWNAADPIFVNDFTSAIPAEINRVNGLIEDLLKRVRKS